MKNDGLSRRELFTLWRRREPPPREPGLPAPLRPPGAVSEAKLADLAEACAGCDKCVAICPVQAIRPLPEGYGPWAGTPHIVAREAPCVLCDDLLCTTVCPSGALRPLRAGQELRIGTAVLHQDRCRAFAGTICDTCAQNCPEPLAIQFNNRGQPRVNAQHCTGCGICEKVCPVDGAAAITVTPA